MGTFKLQYTGTEAVDMIKNYYPQDWQQRIEVKKRALILLSKRENISLEKAYRKYIIPVAGNQESIVFFAALSEMLRLQKMTSKDKSTKVIELEVKRENVAEQIIALENCKIIDYEDKKILRGYYTKLQQETTTEINELINSFDVVEPKLIIHQPGLFDAQPNR